MKKFFLAFLLLLAFIGISRADETEKCFYYFKYQNYQLALQSGKKAIKIDPKNTYAHVCLGATYTKLGYFNLSIKELQIAEKFANNKLDLDVIYSILGGDYDSMGDFNNAVLYYTKELNIAKDLNNADKESRALNNIATIYARQGYYDKALEYFNKSLQLKTNPSSIALTYSNIGTIYSQKGDNVKAVEYFKKAVDIAQKSGDYHGAAMHMINLGDTYIDLRNFSKAGYYLTQGLELMHKLGDKYSEAYAYVSLGKLYMVQNKKDLAKEYFTKAYNLFKATGNNNKAQEVYESYLK